MTELPLVARLQTHGTAVAFRTPKCTYTYQALIDRSTQLASVLLSESNDLSEARVGLLVPAGFDYAAAQLSIWQAGGITVPICLSATEPEWEYTLTDSETSIVLADSAFGKKIEPLCRRLGIGLIDLDAVSSVPKKELSSVAIERRAMILYTSGTTSKPKGVVTTHANIQAQMESLVAAWQWSSVDAIPLFLPMHHIHGIVNVTLCALWAGALIEPFARFDLPEILDRVRADAYTLFMAVPTIYVKLIQFLEAASPEDREAIVGGFARMRLMVSGSAALPTNIFEQWKRMTGQQLLERYGMTEIGMALSNPLHGERRPGTVGMPLPGVEVRLVSETGAVVTSEDEPGEIQVRGPGVFCEYWNRPEISTLSFDNGWFRTGDMAVVERGYYRIMGRLSTDIIKSGGYKLSALEIEATLQEHPLIRECAVLGIADDTWGEAVAVVVVPHTGAAVDLESLRQWCRDRLAAYKIPKRLLVVNELPRNVMGKVTKQVLRMALLAQ